MNFEDAFNKAFEVVDKRSQAEGSGKLQISKSTVSILAFFWNMVVASENKLDDFVYINKNNRIVSIPVKTVEIQAGNRPKPDTDNGKKEAKAGKGKGKKEAKESDTEKTADNTDTTIEGNVGTETADNSGDSGSES